MKPLFVFLNRQMSVPFAWGGFDGGTDCCLLVADWWRWLHGSDPADSLRYCYDSPASCHRLTGWFRDPVAVVSQIAEGRCGLRRTDAPRRGDIGVVRIGDDGAVKTVGAICIGRAWCMKSDGRGVTTTDRVEVMAAWGMGYSDA
ncbi:DUF6950 family protein [Paenirhodobacter enshiensis]|uniref:DUF6950 family protein n=1 Tax=Paenirhodobacter enshiensis TaxID=1105367 RepID=UPI0035AE26A9